MVDACAKIESKDILLTMRSLSLDRFLLDLDPPTESNLTPTLLTRNCCLRSNALESILGKIILERVHEARF